MSPTVQQRIPNPEEVPTLPIPLAGRLAFDLGRAASYEAARRGVLPVIKVGKRSVVPTAELRRLLGLDPTGRAG